MLYPDQGSGGSREHWNWVSCVTSVLPWHCRLLTTILAPWDRLKDYIQPMTQEMISISIQVNGVVFMRNSCVGWSYTVMFGRRVVPSNRSAAFIIRRPRKMVNEAAWATNLRKGPRMIFPNCQADNIQNTVNFCKIRRIKMLKYHIAGAHLIKHICEIIIILQTLLYIF